MSGFLGRTDWAPSGPTTILSGRDGLHSPAWVSIGVGDRPVSESDLEALAARLNVEPQ